ncbi:hypothetical protein POM88_001117 [Heracleum sosnowskyi]|uniref:Uncharacterized protein n=1 Tax=Heracleum sosnowskyi TaxID=360622 RepID=A0AAD8JBW8_9APIA|nr:hypothetical protein POM88_001117 [Heracleum sosnowskyi]
MHLIFSQKLPITKCNCSRKLHIMGALTDNLVPDMVEEEDEEIGRLDYVDEQDIYVPSELVGQEVDRGILTVRIKYAGSISLTSEQVLTCQQFQVKIFRVLYNNNYNKLNETLDNHLHKYKKLKEQERSTGFVESPPELCLIIMSPVSVSLFVFICLPQSCIE